MDSETHVTWPIVRRAVISEAENPAQTCIPESVRRGGLCPGPAWDSLGRSLCRQRLGLPVAPALHLGMHRQGGMHLPHPRALPRPPGLGPSPAPHPKPSIPHAPLQGGLQTHVHTYKDIEQRLLQ